MPEIGIAHYRFAHRRIVGDAVEVARSAFGERCAREHTEVGAINVLTLQIGNGGFEAFRTVKNGDRLAVGLSIVTTTSGERIRWREST